MVEQNENQEQPPFKHVVISGMGLMGLGIGQCCVESGYKTWLLARNDDKAKRAKQDVENEKATKLHADNEQEAQQWVEERMSRLHVGTDLKDALVGADLFIEAVIENREIKQDLFAEVEQLGPNGIVLVTNTSSMRLSDLGEKLQRPENLGGLHFFSPVPAMKVVEVVKSEKTADDVAQRLDDFGKSLGKVTILCKDTPGFVINRMVLPLLNISHTLVDEGVASLESIDLASKLGMNLPLGLLSLSDMIGLDTIWNANKEMMNYEGVMDLKPVKCLDRLVAQGKLGRKSGCGFFDYKKK
ncbi:Hydroxyacyl-coenzyme A dehydrogenase, mitochondrial-like isoform X2 [Aphelenchoides bicaudatus]|nr:Hydroxyacyl-coenzyme A dehydrogenase, mitochondrial-like isoform X2 [Aphelenchoides bicaudatus]